MYKTIAVETQRYGEKCVLFCVSIECGEKKNLLMGNYAVFNGKWKERLTVNGDLVYSLYQMIAEIIQFLLKSKVNNWDNDWLWQGHKRYIHI